MTIGVFQEKVLEEGYAGRVTLISATHATLLLKMTGSISFELSVAYVGRSVACVAVIKVADYGYRFSRRFLGNASWILAKLAKDRQARQG